MRYNIFWKDSLVGYFEVDMTSRKLTKIYSEVEDVVCNPFAFKQSFKEVESVLENRRYSKDRRVKIDELRCAFYDDVWNEIGVTLSSDYDDFVKVVREDLELIPGVIGNKGNQEKFMLEDRSWIKYDYMGAMVWPKMAINYTTKTQFLFRINKGILDVNTKSSDELNAFTPEENRRIPFKNIIYVGDGITDVPCMKLVREYGGNSIAVYNEANGERDRKKVQKLLEYQRVNFATAANYTKDSELDQIVKAVIRKANAVFRLEQFQKPVYIELEETKE